MTARPLTGPSLTMTPLGVNERLASIEAKLDAILDQQAWQAGMFRELLDWIEGGTGRSTEDPGPPRRLRSVPPPL